MKRFISLLLLLLPAAAAAQPPVAPEQAPESKAAPAPAEALRAPRPDTVALPMHDHTGLVGECPYRHAFTEPRSVVPLTPCGNAYAKCRRMLGEDKLPAAGDVHIDQLVNHFTYDYPAPTDGAPLSFTAEMAPCPWNAEHRLVRFGIRLRDAADTTLLPLRHARLRVEFNPAQVVAYRLVGDDRILPQPRHRHRRHDAARRGGRLEAGYSTTILYEVIPAEAVRSPERASALRFESREGVPVVLIPSSELLTARVRYHLPGVRRGEQITATLKEENLVELTGDFAFAAAVAMYGQLLSDSEFRGDSTWDKVLELAEKGLGSDPDEERREFIALVRMAQMLDSRR